LMSEVVPFITAPTASPRGPNASVMP